MSASKFPTAISPQNANQVDVNRKKNQEPTPNAWLGISGLVLILLWFVFVLLYSPITAPYDLDYDEGINLAKADLMRAGYDLYAEIWSDQPPLFTATLAGWMALFGRNVFVARLLVLGMSAALLWALFQVTYQQTSFVAALAIVILLVTSEEHFRLSVSVMIGLPALAFAVWSMYLMVLAKLRGSMPLLIGSTLLMALALQSKLMVATATPALAVYWLLVSSEHGVNNEHVAQRIKSLLIWTVAFVTAFGLIGWWFGVNDPTQLILPHFGTETRTAFSQTQNGSYLRQTFLRHGLAVVLALLGTLSLENWRRGQLLLPLTWLLASTALLMVHRPLWHHHVVLITVPLAWLSAFGVQALVNALHIKPASAGPGSNSRSLALGSLLILTILVAVYLYPKRIDRTIAEETYRALPNFDGDTMELVERVARERPGMMLTDRPFYAFQAGVLVPPWTAAFTRKRIVAGQLSEEQVLDTIRARQPDQILFERFAGTFDRVLTSEFPDQYCTMSTHESADYFVRKPCKFVIDQ